jgi:hypothetical protein
MTNWNKIFAYRNRHARRKSRSLKVIKKNKWFGVGLVGIPNKSYKTKHGTYKNLHIAAPHKSVFENFHYYDKNYAIPHRRKFLGRKYYNKALVEYGNSMCD